MGEEEVSVVIAIYGAGAHCVANAPLPLGYEPTCQKRAFPRESNFSCRGGRKRYDTWGSVVVGVFKVGRFFVTPDSKDIEILVKFYLLVHN